MRLPRKRGSTSNMVRTFIPDNTVTNGAGCTGLTSSSTNLVIAAIRKFDATATTYSGANIEAITTIGTYQAPSSSSKVRFKAVDATNFPGLYELHFHDSATIFGAADVSDSVEINILETATTALKIGPNMAQIPLIPLDYQDSVRFGMTALPNVAAAASGGLPTIGVTIPNATAGAAGGLFIAGTNAATTVTTSFTTTFTGNLTGSVGSVTGAVGSVTGNVGGNVTGSVGSVVGSTAQTGDSFARIGALGVGLTALAPSATALSTAQWTNTRAGFLDNLDAAISTRLATAGYTTPPTTAAIATAIFTDLMAGSDFSTAASFGKLVKDNLDIAVSSRLAPTVASRTLDVSATGEAGIDWANVGSPTTTVALSGTTIGTVTAYTGNTPQTGDSFARIGALGAGLTALAPSATALSNVQWTNARAVRLDHLDVDVSSVSGGGGGGSDTPGTTTLLSRLTAQRAINLDYLDAPITSISGGGGGGGGALPADGVDAIMVESGINLRQAIAIIGAYCAGKGGPSSSVYRGMGVTDTRISYVANDGERTTVTLTPPA